MQPDIDKYRPYLDRFDLSEAQKDEFIHTMWGIMESFVDRAFGLDSVQLACKAAARGDSIAPPNGVESGQPILSDNFRRAAGPTGGQDDTDDEEH